MIFPFVKRNKERKKCINPLKRAIMSQVFNLDNFCCITRRIPFAPLHLILLLLLLFCTLRLLSDLLPTSYVKS